MYSKSCVCSRTLIPPEGFWQTLERRIYCCKSAFIKEHVKGNCAKANLRCIGLGWVHNDLYQYVGLYIPVVIVKQ